jgi:hypothetical protein
MTITIDALSLLAYEDYTRKDEEQAKRRATREALQKPKAEPGRARPNHGARTSSRRRMTSLGGDS